MPHIIGSAHLGNMLQPCDTSHNSPEGVACKDHVVTPVLSQVLPEQSYQSPVVLSSRVSACS